MNFSLHLSLVQVILTFFLLFALSRVVLRFKGGVVSVTGFVFWSILFIFAIAAVLVPEVTSKIAKTAGIGRGVDAVVYASIVLLFYLVFRINIYLEDIRKDITTLVRKISLEKETKKNGKKISKN